MGKEPPFIEHPTPLRTLEVKSPGASAEELRKRRKHVLKVRNSDGEHVERVVFRGFADSELDHAIDAFIVAHAMGDAEGSFLWDQLYREALQRGDP